MKIRLWYLAIPVVLGALYYFYSKRYGTPSSVAPATATTYLPLAMSPNDFDPRVVSVDYQASNHGMLPPYPSVSGAYNPIDLINTYQPYNLYSLPPVPSPRTTRYGSDITEYLNYSVSDSQGHGRAYYYAADRTPDFLLSTTDQLNLNKVRIEQARYHNLASPLLVSRAVAYAGFTP